VGFKAFDTSTRILFVGRREKLNWRMNSVRKQTGAGVKIIEFLSGALQEMMRMNLEVEVAA